MHDTATPASCEAATGPLAGVRVIELGSLLAGPFAGQLIADLGADVVKV
jgi:formyl-CoA transferase